MKTNTQPPRYAGAGRKKMKKKISPFLTANQQKWVKTTESMTEAERNYCMRRCTPATRYAVMMALSLSGRKQNGN